MYKPITDQLPVVGSARETETCDFKARLHRLPDDKVDQVGIALPVAAFANRAGGSIIYGAPEASDGTVHGYLAMTDPEVAETIRQCDLAIKERCVPSPLWSHAVIAGGGGRAVVINVEPYTAALVGGRVSADGRKGGYNGPAFAFPMRVGSHTQHLTPDQIPMFMDPKVRRTVAILSKLRQGEEVELALGPSPCPRYKGAFKSLKLELNALDIAVHGWIPIDRIESVYYDGHKWVVICPF